MPGAAPHGPGSESAGLSRGSASAASSAQIHAARLPLTTDPQSGPIRLQVRIHGGRVNTHPPGAQPDHRDRPGTDQALDVDSDTLSWAAVSRRDNGGAVATRSVL